MNRLDEKVLTIGVFAHANAGKTTITEHLLYHAGVIKSIGRVDLGNTVTDNLKVEQDRGITVRDSLVSFNIDDKVIQLIDTPGHIDFSAEVERAISVLDGAILVISGVEGLEAQTFTIYRALKERKVPIIIFINKMDRKGADFNRVVKELQNHLKIPTLTLTNVYKDSDDSINVEPSSIEDMVKELSLVDDEVLDGYLNNTILDRSLISNKIIELVNDSKLFIVIGGSALLDIGINDLIDSIGKYIPVTNKRVYEPFSAYVYTIRINDNIKNAYIKVLSGSISLRDNIKLDNEQTGKIKKLYLADGFKLESVDKVYGGDIAIVNGLDVRCGEFIGDTNNINNYVSFVNPILTMEVIPDNIDDAINLMDSLRILNEEDPYLNIRYNEKTRSINCNLMGEVQAQIIKTYLEERFNIKVSIKNPIIIHKETPTIRSKGKASYTSVSGIEIEVTPLEVGSGFKYVSKVSTDYLHIKYQRQVERLIRKYSKQGLYGWELTDVEVALVDGQFDSMGSDPMHFNIVTPLALFRSLKGSKIDLLEPISSFNIVTPSNTISAVTKLLSSKNAIYEINQNIEEMITISGEVSTANMLNFPIELSMITSGMASYSYLITKYKSTHNQKISCDFIGPDPRNETTFIINDMKVSLEPLDKTLMKKKKESRSKYKRQHKNML